MKNNILSFLAGVVFGGAGLAIAGLIFCEYVEALPTGAPNQEGTAD